MSNGFRGINARVGGNVINPLPYLQQSQQANPWYNPLMKGPDIMGGMSATLNKLKVEEERERRAGLEEREVGAKELTAEAGMKRSKAMEKYYAAMAMAAGQPAPGKTLSKKDQMMLEAVKAKYGEGSEELEHFVTHDFKLPKGATYPDELILPAIQSYNKRTGKKLTLDRVSTPQAQRMLIDQHFKYLAEAEAGLSTDAMSPESVQANRNAEIRFVRDTFDSEMGQLILLGQYEDTTERVKMFEGQTGVRLDLPHEYSVIKRLKKRNPELVNNEQRAYVKLIDSTSNAFFKMWDEYGDKLFDDFENPKFINALHDVDDIDVDAIYWMYFIHSGRFASMADEGKDKDNILMKLLTVLNTAKKSVEGYYEK